MIAQSVANILRDHVKLSVEGIDRMYLSCRYRHERYNAAFQIMPSNLSQVPPRTIPVEI
jgi:hypothetical protein